MQLSGWSVLSSISKSGCNCEKISSQKLRERREGNDTRSSAPGGLPDTAFESSELGPCPHFEMGRMNRSG